MISLLSNSKDAKRKRKRKKKGGKLFGGGNKTKSDSTGSHQKTVHTKKKQNPLLRFPFITPCVCKANLPV